MLFLMLSVITFPIYVFAVEKTEQKNIFEMSLSELMDVSVKVDVASLFEENELVIGSSVSRIDSKNWKQRGARRMHEALDAETSIISYTTFGGAPNTFIRGYARQTARGISYLLDGVPINEGAKGTAIYHVSNWELGTLDRIEVIKGPGSAIYGASAFHGVISMKTFDMNKDFLSIEGAGATSSYGDVNLLMSQGIGKNSGRINMAVAGSRQEDQNLDYEYTNNKGTYKNKYHSQSGVFKLTADPSDRMKIKFGGYLSNWDGDDFPSIGKLGSDDLGSNESLFTMGNGSIVYTFQNSISVQVAGYYFQSDNKIDAVVAPGPTNFEQEETHTGSGASLIIKQPENSLNLQWLLAYSYTKAETKDTSYLLNYSIDLGELAYDGFNREINSLFGQAKLGVCNNHFYIIAGARFDDYSDFGDQFSPRAGLIYLPSEKSAIKMLYGNAFIAPSGVDLYGQKILMYGNKDLKPETIDVYELIYMQKGKDWKYSINGFYSYWKDAIVIESTSGLPPGFSQMYVNKGKNQAYGAEADFYYSMKPWAINLGISYIKSEAIDVEDPDDPLGTKDQDYDTFPVYSVLIGIYYNLLPYGINFYLNNRIYIKMKETVAQEEPDAEELPTYFRTDLNISKKISDKLELSLNIRNLFDSENSLPPLWGVGGGLEEPGISVLLRASYKL